VRTRLSAINFAHSDQVEHLTDLLVEAESAAKRFFARNFVTQGMERLLRQGLQRLYPNAGRAD
jgi:predicted AAA+ superfamily ATPase